MLLVLFLLSSHLLTHCPFFLECPPTPEWWLRKPLAFLEGIVRSVFPVVRLTKSYHYHHTYKLVPRTLVKSLWNFSASACVGSDCISLKSGRVLGKSQVSNTYTLNEQKDTRKCRRNLLNVLVINRKTSILELFCNLLFCTLNFSHVFMCIHENTHILACTCTHFLN